MTVAAGSFGNMVDERDPDDFYPTPAWCTDALLDAESFDGLIWEPAFGNGAISDRLIARGYRVRNSDIKDHGHGAPLFMRQDFLEASEQAANIITNPPYKLLSQFAGQALSLATRKVALLTRLNWLAPYGENDRPIPRRCHIAHPTCKRVVMLGRVSMLPPGVEDKGGSPTTDYCWIVWDQNHSNAGGPIITFPERRS